jgi:hypothetical protein
MEVQKNEGRRIAAPKTGNYNVTGEGVGVNVYGYAEKYLEMGWSIIPVRIGNKVPYPKWKRYQTQLPTKTLWKGWLKKWTDGHIALITGLLSGVWVLDFDSPEELEWFRNEVYSIPETLIQKTGRDGGGYHIFFRRPAIEAHFKSINFRDTIGRDFELKADNAIAILAPSLHKSGKRYEWVNINPIEDGLDDLLEMPPEILAFCQNGGKDAGGDPGKVIRPDFTQKNEPGWVNELIQGVRDGCRNNAAAKLSGWFLRQFSGDENATLTVMRDWNNRNLDREGKRPCPLSDDIIVKTVNSIAKRQGLDNFSEKIGHVIYRLEILNYPDKDARYNLYVEGQDTRMTFSHP